VGRKTLQLYSIRAQNIGNILIERSLITIVTRAMTMSWWQCHKQCPEYSYYRYYCWDASI